MSGKKIKNLSQVAIIKTLLIYHLKQTWKLHDNPCINEEVFNTSKFNIMVPELKFI